MITPDGGAPRRLARPGVLVLAAACNVPLIPLGAACRPAVVEPRKWDQPRNPVPFGRIAISIGSPLKVEDFLNPAALESERVRLEQALNACSESARRALDLAG